ncbi:hypothetical protein A2U01_0047734, partial [Trifolium medium]|nr:hypothetical protein [Trifolium medium]
MSPYIASSFTPYTEVSLGLLSIVPLFQGTPCPPGGSQEIDPSLNVDKFLPEFSKSDGFPNLVRTSFPPLALVPTARAPPGRTFTSQSSTKSGSNNWPVTCAYRFLQQENVKDKITLGFPL